MTLCDRCDLDVDTVRSTPEWGLLCPDCLHTATPRLWGLFHICPCSCGWRSPQCLYRATARQLWRDHARTAA